MDEPVASCLSKNHHEHRQHRPCDSVELGLRVQRRRDAVEARGQRADAVNAQFPDGQITELGHEIAVDLALIRADRAERAALAVLLRLGAHSRNPLIGVLGESDGQRHLCSGFRSAARRNRRRRRPLPAGDRRMHACEPRPRIGLGEERQRLVILRASRVGPTIWCGVASLPAAGRELPKAPPPLPLRGRDSGRPGRAHRALL
jgi:hypothetical protein